MSGSRRSLRRVLPDRPGRRYTVFAGPNRWREWFAACPRLVTGGPGGGDEIRAFEAAAATHTGCRFGFGFGAGRMGFYVLLETLGLEPGDEIILPGFTCAVVPNAMVYRKVRPIYVDIDPVTFNIDPLKVEAAITPRTRAILAQHTFGVGCDVRRLREIADRHGLLLIEDAAHSLGARIDGRPHGAFGDAAFFSTDRTKVINTHVGGCVVTSDESLAERLGQRTTRLRRLGPVATRRIVFSFLAEFLLESPPLLWIGRPVLGALRRLGLLFYWTDEQMDALPAGYPYPCRITAPQARLGLSQLDDLPANLAHRLRIARWLEDRLGWYGDALPGRFEEQAWLRYSFLVCDREAFVERFGRRMFLGIWFPSVIFGREGCAAAVGYEPAMCPVAESVARHIVNLPTHRRIPLAMIQRLWSRHGDWARSQLLRLD